MKYQSSRSGLIKLLILAMAGVVFIAGLALALAQRRQRAGEERARRVSAADSGNSQVKASEAPGESGGQAVKGPRTITVKAGGDLQKALKDARPGDTITLEAGARFVGSFTLPYKAGTNTDSDWITIRTSTPDSSLPGPQERITPARANLLPKIISPGRGEPAIRTEPGAHHYRFIGVEITRTGPDAVVYDLVKLGDWDPQVQSTMAAVPHHLVFDRCYIHGDQSDLKRGIALNSASTEILNSYFADFHVRGQEAQAICGWNGPGPFRIINNYIEAAGENFMLGGAWPSIPNLVPTGLEVRRNHFYKPPSWRGKWTVKNLLELKNARQVVIDGNLFEYCWTDAQVGYAILFTPRPNDSGAAAVVEDVTFTNNIVRHVAAVFHIQGGDSLYGPDPNGLRGRRIRIANNLIQADGPKWGGDGCFMKIGGTQDVTVENNTVDQTGNITKTWGAATSNFVFVNNIINHNEYGIHGDEAGVGKPAIDRYFPGAVIKRNIIAGADAGIYPPDNFYPISLDDAKFIDRAGGNYRLAPNSKFKGKGYNGKEIGCNIDALEAAIDGAALSRSTQ